MTFAADLFNFLDTNANITTEVASRISPSFADKNETLPYITFQKISDPQHNQMLAAAGIANPTYQFDVWADSNLSRAKVAEVLRNEMDGFRGAIGATSGTSIRRMILVGQSEEVEEPTDGSADPFFRMRMDFEIWYARSVPTL